MLYLAAKLSKYDINNWVGKTANQTRWWEMFVNGVTLDLLEGLFVCLFFVPSVFSPKCILISECYTDICHQVLDLYSQKRPSSSNSSTSLTSSSSTVSAPPPPPVYSVPPPVLPMNPSHDGGPPGMYSSAPQYNAIPTHYSGAGSQYGSYSQYGSNY